MLCWKGFRIDDVSITAVFNPFKFSPTDAVKCLEMIEL